MNQSLMEEYPKLAMLVVYILENYPKHAKELTNNPIIITAVGSPEISNPSLENIVDNLAALNGWKKESS